MILHRTVFQAKMGKADDMVTLIKNSISEITDEQRAMFQPRILTDISGSFDTVVVETVHQSLATYEEFRKMMRQRNAESDTRNEMREIMESGRSEFYTIEL